MSFHDALARLIAPLDAGLWEPEIKRLRACRTLAELEAVSRDGGGWIAQRPSEPKLKLVKHGKGTYIVVHYKDGWSSRLSMVDFPGR